MESHRWIKKSGFSKDRRTTARRPIPGTPAPPGAPSFVLPWMVPSTPKQPSGSRRRNVGEFGCVGLRMVGLLLLAVAVALAVEPPVPDSAAKVGRGRGKRPCRGGRDPS